MSTATLIRPPEESLALSPELLRRRRRSLFFLGWVIACAGFAMTLQLGLNSNFVGQEMRLSGLQQGVLETFRETCGITVLLVLALFAGLAEPLIAAAMLVPGRRSRAG